MTQDDLRRPNYILTTFWRHSDYILTTLWLHSDYILITFWLNSDSILTTLWRHSDYILTTFWLHPDDILTTNLVFLALEVAPIDYTNPHPQLSFTTLPWYCELTIVLLLQWNQLSTNRDVLLIIVCIPFQLKYLILRNWTLAGIQLDPLDVVGTMKKFGSNYVNEDDKIYSSRK